jgi:alpha-galactosidase/6-phospho-beta-glucosidase family protein
MKGISMAADVLLDGTEIRTLLAHALRDVIQKDTYQSPVRPIAERIIKEYTPQIEQTCRVALRDITSDPEFAALLRQEMRHKMARALVAELSGSIDKAVNAFRQDPRVRADMVKAIERIIEAPVHATAPSERL